MARGRGAQALADAERLLEQALARDPDFDPAQAMIAYDYALTPLFAPSLRAGRPDEERKITDRVLTVYNGVSWGFDLSVTVPEPASPAVLLLGFLSTVFLLRGGRINLDRGGATPSPDTAGA